MVEIKYSYNDTYILNPIYVLKNDISRIVLATIDLKDFESSKHNNIITFILPEGGELVEGFKEGYKSTRNKKTEDAKNG